MVHVREVTPRRDHRSLPPARPGARDGGVVYLGPVPPLSSWGVPVPDSVRGWEKCVIRVGMCDFGTGVRPTTMGQKQHYRWSQNSPFICSIRTHHGAKTAPSGRNHSRYSFLPSGWRLYVPFSSACTVGIPAAWILSIAARVRRPRAASLSSFGSFLNCSIVIFFMAEPRPNS